MILNDIWPEYNYTIQINNAGEFNSDIDRKMAAFNTAQAYLIKRMFQLGRTPDEFVKDPTNVANTIDTNYVALPSDYLTYKKLWWRSGTSYMPIGENSIISYQDLLVRNDQNFFNTGNFGTPTLCAVKEPNLYFDTHFNNVFTEDETITGTDSGATATIDEISDGTLTLSSVVGTFQVGEVITGSVSGTTATIDTISLPDITVTNTGGTTDIKLSYYFLPSDVEAYDKITITGVSGTFQVGEQVTTITSSGTVKEVAATYLYIYTSGRTGAFTSGETVTGTDSSATAATSGTLENRASDIDWTTKYKFLIVEAAALIWLHYKRSNSVPTRSAEIDQLIEMYTDINVDSTVAAWSIP